MKLTRALGVRDVVLMNVTGRGGTSKLVWGCVLGITLHKRK